MFSRRPVFGGWSSRYVEWGEKNCELFFLYGTEDTAAPTVIPSFDLCYEGGIPAPVAGDYTNLTNFFTNLPANASINPYYTGWCDITLPTMVRRGFYDMNTLGMQFGENTHYYFVLRLNVEDGYCFDTDNLSNYCINGVAPVFMTSSYTDADFYYDYPATVLRVYTMIDEFNIDTAGTILPPVPGGDAGRSTAWMSQSFEHFTLDSAKWVEKGLKAGEYTDFGTFTDADLRFAVNKIYGVCLELVPVKSLSSCVEWRLLLRCRIL